MRVLRVLFILSLLSSPLWGKSRVEIAQENSPAIVAINVLKQDGTTLTGTGFFITQDGVFATNQHVIDNALYVSVTFNTGALSGQAQLIAQDKQTDLALLKIAAQNLPVLTLADSDYVLAGQEITVIGNPRRLQNTVSSGLISQVRQKPNGLLIHQISAPISPSSSGSPVFNDQGQVVSVASSSYSGQGDQNLNFSIPSNYLTQLLSQTPYHAFIAPAIPATTQLSWYQRVVNHLKKSWTITKRLFSSRHTT